MSDADPFFVVRAGTVWACWLDGKPAAELGSEANFWSAVEKLWHERHPPPPAAPPAREAGPPAIKKERVADRHEVTIVGRLYATGGSREVVIFDLSPEGCRIEDSGRSKAGDIVSIKIGTVGPLQAVIRWRGGDFAGLNFDNPLHPSVLDHIRRRISLR